MKLQVIFGHLVYILNVLELINLDETLLDYLKFYLVNKNYVNFISGNDTSIRDFKIILD